MIRVVLTNEILKRISHIDENKFVVNKTELPPIVSDRFRKNSRMRSAYSSNKIEGNPLSEIEAEQAIESDPHRHFLKPEIEIRNYYQALRLLEEKEKCREKFSKDLILEIQACVENGASEEKIGLRGAMPPGFLFAVYDSKTGNADYIPPEFSDIPKLLSLLNM